MATGRVISLDVFRGLTVAAMVLVNNPGSWRHVYWPLRARRLAWVDADGPGLPVLPRSSSASRSRSASAAASRRARPAAGCAAYPAAIRRSSSRWGCCCTPCRASTRPRSAFPGCSSASRCAISRRRSSPGLGLANGGRGRRRRRPRLLGRARASCRCPASTPAIWARRAMWRRGSTGSSSVPTSGAPEASTIPRAFSARCPRSPRRSSASWPAGSSAAGSGTADTATGLFVGGAVGISLGLAWEHWLPINKALWTGLVCGVHRGGGMDGPGRGLLADRGAGVAVVDAPVRGPGRQCARRLLLSRRFWRSS